MDAVDKLGGQQTLWLVGAALGLVMVSGAVVVLGRVLLDPKPRNERDGAASLIRSTVFMTLVGALVLFGAVSFGLTDATLRNTLVGGLLASSGTATAFYFASRASDQARKDILGATTGSAAWVPELRGSTVATAKTLLAASPLVLTLAPGVPDDAVIAEQQPAPGSSVARGSAITVSSAPAPVS
ncbi:hypothetical protein FHX74_003361 [Friedmanniella endophytica]|uniref:PASTA domain-containing protein n=1 Tax=Microlunatus kandeliicorticis TaxID=1759536 RepID=A0A7W3IV34_9ACTN|nr:PASTA domain-containing protein [Microlunatus kandeliicorticis]MBA8795725.1 hypothetical protein [Microlunatus kandeliicorticis]